MSNAAEKDAYELALFKATVKLSGATDTCYIVARHTEDAVQQVRAGYAEFNVLFIQSVERVAGTILISQEAKEGLLEALA
jgi:hypothetical protein